MSSLLRLERKQKNSANPLKIRTFLFLSYPFGIETINTFIHSRRSLENQTWFQINMGKYPSPPPPFGPNCSLNPYPEFTSDLIQILLKTSRIYSRVRISCKENKSNRSRLVQRCSKLRTTTFCKDLFLKKKEIWWISNIFLPKAALSVFNSKHFLNSEILKVFWRL